MGAEGLFNSIESLTFSMKFLAIFYNWYSKISC